MIDQVASAHRRELEKCAGGEVLHGDIAVTFVVDARGSVASSQVTTVLDMPKVAACILRVVQSWQFPRQGPAGARGAYTLSFQ